jgi:hypothetical protein
MRIALSAWSVCLAVALPLSGCTPPKTLPVVRVPARDEPLARPASPPPLPPEALGDATLSYLEALAPGQCRWVQHTPPDVPRPVLELPTGCQRVHLAWSPDGLEALVHFTTPSRGDSRDTHHLWRVDLTTGRWSALPAPSLGAFTRHGFDPQGRPLALMEDALYQDEDGQLVPPADGSPPHVTLVIEERGDRRQRLALFEGRRYPLEDVGVAGLAHALRWEDGRWRRIETASSFYEVDHALGVYALKALADLGPTPEDMEDDAQGAFEAMSERHPLLAQLPDELPVPASESETLEPYWQERKTPYGALYANLGGESELSFLTPPVFVQGTAGPEPLPLPGIADGTPINLFVRGELALVVDERGARSAARLWNLRTRRAVASVDGKTGLTFWPRPTLSP